MSDLILNNQLRTTTKGDDEIRVIARIRTLTVLHMLDGTRKGLVLQFLWESGLINTPPIISLNGADFSNVKLFNARLPGADLSHANFSNSDLRYVSLAKTNLVETIFDNSNLPLALFDDANLEMSSFSDARLTYAEFNNANLTGATLRNASARGANFKNANLYQTSLMGTDLSGANVYPGQLDHVFSLRRAILPDGSRHD